MFLKKL